MAKRKRKSTRVKRRLPVQVWKAGTEESLSGTTKDVSADGIFVQTQKPFPPGTEVVVEMLFSGKTIKLEGVVKQASRVAAALQSVQTSGMGIDAELPGEFVKDVLGDRRASPRVPVKISVVGFYGSEKHIFNLRVLSETGALLVSKGPLAVIAFTRMNFKLTRRSRVLDLDGIPIRIQPEGDHSTIAVKFLDPAEEIAEQLKAFVEERRGGKPSKPRKRRSRR